jgi:hypothetical protein
MTEEIKYSYKRGYPPDITKLKWFAPVENQSLASLLTNNE